MKAEFTLTLFDDQHVKDKLVLLSKLEAMFDDARNTLPKEYYWFADEVPMGAKVKITMEVVND